MTGDQAIYLMEKFKKESMNDNKDSQQMKAGESEDIEMTETKVKIEVDNNQARNLLLSECENIRNKVTSLADAIDNIVYYNARTKSFRAVCERYQTAREAAYYSIVQLDKLANELFPLFGDIENENEKEQE